MKEQNYSNHVRYHPLFHFVAAPLILAGLIGSVVNLVGSDPGNRYSAALIVLLFLLMFLVGMFARGYALMAQDRAIRAEERLRHFILTGRQLDSRLRMGQIVALRFAPDEEFPELARKAAEDRLTGKQIKESIRKWNADFRRI